MFKQAEDPFTSVGKEEIDHMRASMTHRLDNVYGDSEDDESIGDRSISSAYTQKEDFDYLAATARGELEAARMSPEPFDDEMSIGASVNSQQQHDDHASAYLAQMEGEGSITAQDSSLAVDTEPSLAPESLPGTSPDSRKKVTMNLQESTVIDNDSIGSESVPSVALLKESHSVLQQASSVSGTTHSYSPQSSRNTASNAEESFVERISGVNSKPASPTGDVFSPSIASTAVAPSSPSGACPVQTTVNSISPTASR